MDPQPAAIFFDLDGTILDWQTGMEKRWLASIERHNDGSYDPVEMYEMVRKRRDWFWDDPERAKTGRMDLNEASRVIVRHAFEDAGLTAVDVANRIGDYYRAERRELIAPYPGAMETIAAFHARGIRLALLTNGETENQRESVESWGWSRTSTASSSKASLALASQTSASFATHWRRPAAHRRRPGWSATAWMPTSRRRSSWGCTPCGSTRRAMACLTMHPPAPTALSGQSASCYSY